MAYSTSHYSRHDENEQMTLFDWAYSLPPHSLAAVPAAKASYTRCASASRHLGHSHTPAGTFFTAGSRHPKWYPSRQLSQSSILLGLPALLQTWHAWLAGALVSVGSTVRSMLGLWQGAQFSRCSLKSVPSAPCNTSRPFAPT